MTIHGELSVDLNPFNSADAHGDKDHDGLDNLWEYENGTMINDNDTDHDGIDDGAELYYWNVTRGIPNETAVDYLKDPDVDRDNVTDGKEINGWTVKIIVGYDEQNNPISKDVTLYGDPLAAYKDPEGNYIDSDEDNIPDIVESLLSNNSTFAKFADWALNNDPQTWNDYSWCIAYFYSIALGYAFSTVYDDIKNNKISAIKKYENEIKAVVHNDRYKAQIENATQWLRDEFNPLITESMAPVITEFHVTTVYEGYVAPLVPNAKAHVVAEIRDVAGISRVRIRSLCPDVIYILMIWTQEFQFSGDETTVYIDTVIDVTEYSAVLTYNISVNATDTLGNSAEWYKEVDGPFGEFIKTVANMLRAFWNFLCEVGKVLVKAFEILIEWIKSLIISAINSIFSPIIERIDLFGKNLGMALDEIYRETNGDWKNIKVKHLMKMNNVFLPLWLLCVGIGVLALMILMGVTFGAGTLLTLVISLIISLVVTEIFGLSSISKYSLDISGVMGIRGILELMKEILGFDGKRRNDEEIPAWAWGFFSVLFGWGSFIMGAISYIMAKEDSTGSLAGILAMAATLFGIIFGFVSASLTKDYQIDFAGLCGLFFGIEGIIFSLFSFKGANKGAIVVGLVGMALGSISIFLALKAMGVI